MNHVALHAPMKNRDCYFPPPPRPHSTQNVYLLISMIVRDFENYVIFFVPGFPPSFPVSPGAFKRFGGTKHFRWQRAN